MNKNIILIVALAIVSLSSCTNNKTEKTTEFDSIYLKEASGTPCNLTIGNLHFTKSVNNAISSIQVVNGDKVIFTASENTDYFRAPDKQSSKNSAPILLTKIDNSKPFTFTAKVTPEFTKTGVYNAGVVYIYSNDLLFQKLCFEQDERGLHRVVTVRTIETSDDNNHDEVKQPYVYMKISSDGQTIGSYYSLDKKSWQMVRLYRNNYSSEVWFGISSQCPMLGEKQSTTIFEEIHFEEKSISNFRLGI